MKFVIPTFDFWTLIVPTFFILLFFYTLSIAEEKKHDTLIVVLFVLFFASFCLIITGRIWDAGWAARDKTCPKSVEDNSVPAGSDSETASSKSQ